MKKIFSIVALATITLALQSCLKDDDELFELSSAERIEKAADDTRTLLKSAKNGWMMHYYTGQEYSGTGLTMFMRFDETKAYVASDLADPDSISSSSWDIKKDQGVVITFDTYNEIMHYLAEPSGSSVDGEEADYEFVVLRTTEDSIYVRGKKWGNHMVMTRVSDDTSWADYINGANIVSSQIAWYYKTNDNTQLKFDYANRRLYVGDDNTGMPYATTPDGVVFPEAVTIDGQSVTSLDYNPTDRTVSNAKIGKLQALTFPLSTLLKDNLWYLTSTDMSTAAANNFYYLYMGAYYSGFSIGYICFGQLWGAKWGMNIGIVASGYLYQSYVDYDFTVVDDNTISLTGGTLDTLNGTYVYNNFYGNYAIDMVGLGDTTTTWKLSTDDPQRPSYILFEKQGTSQDIAFYVMPQMVIYPFE